MSLESRLQQKRFSSPTERAWLAVLTAGAHLRQLSDELLAAYGITSDQYNVLRILRGVYPDGHARCDIATRLLNRAPDVTRLVDRLEKRGLAERTRSQEDRRLSLTRITQSGLDLLSRIDPQMTATQANATTGLAPDDLRRLARLCEALIP